MSILRVDEIRDNGAGFNDVVTFANSGGTENGRLARAWVNFNGQGTIAMRANFNVNSITDNAVGDYTVNFTNSMADANYAITTSTTATGSGGPILVVSNITDPTSSALRLLCGDVTNVKDMPFQSVAIFR